MKAVLKSLIDIGGVTTRKDIKKDLYDNSALIPEDYIDFKRISKNSGKEYKPFHYQFNFAIKHLEFADYVTFPNRTFVELTEKGRKVKLDKFNPDIDVRPISEQLMSKESEKRKNEKKITKSEDEELVEVEVEEVWRDQLKEALKQMTPQKFELFARALISKMGIEFDKTIGMQNGSDNGLDGFGYITADDYRTTRVAL